MFSIYNFSEPQLLSFFLVLLRISAFVMVWPVLGGQQVPAHCKILLALVISVIIFPVVSWQSVATEVISQKIIWLSFKEVFIGLSIGFLTRLFFLAVSSAGHFISLSMGLSQAQVFNPSLGAQGNAVEQVQLAIATLFFLAINAHHVFLSGLVQSFSFVPLSMQGLNFSVFSDIAMVGHEILIITIKIAAPVFVSVLLMNLTMGVIGRAVPQINVLITSLPINILVGFLILILTLPLFMSEISGFLNSMTMVVFKYMKAI